MVYSKAIELESTGRRVRFFNMTEAVRTALAESGIQNGIVVVYSQHTSCSVFLQEDSEDATYWGTPLVLQDMLNLFDRYIPICTAEGQYLHPGRIHTQNAVSLRNEELGWLLNTEAHLRSVLLGRSESIPVINRELLLGEFGCVYFADFDQTRDRTRTFRIQIVGE